MSLTQIKMTLDTVKGKRVTASHARVWDFRDCLSCTRGLVNSDIEVQYCVFVCFSSMAFTTVSASLPFRKFRVEIRGGP